MLAYKISVNGSHVITAGHSDWAILAAHLTASRVNPEKPGALRDIHFRVGGLIENETLAATDPGASEHFRYPVLDLVIGDTVSVEIVDVPDVNAPEKVYTKTLDQPTNDSSENAG